MSEFFRKIKMAWQRATKGYCDEDSWSYYDWFCKNTPKILRQLTDESIGVPQKVINRTEKDFPNLNREEIVDIAFERWKAEILDFVSKIEHIYSDEFEENEYDDEYCATFNIDDNFKITYDESKEAKEITKKWLKRQNEIGKAREKELKEAMKWLGENLDELWW